MLRNRRKSREEIAWEDLNEWLARTKRELEIAESELDDSDESIERLRKAAASLKLASEAVDHYDAQLGLMVA